MSNFHATEIQDEGSFLFGKILNMPSSWAGKSARHNPDSTLSFDTIGRMATP